MASIAINHLSYTWPGSFDPVFQDLTLQLDTTWHLALVAPNGRGKTTLLQLLSGALDSGGAIRCTVPCVYFPAPVSDPEAMALDVLLAAAPGIEQWQLLREIALLDVPPEKLYLPFSTLSGGEQTKCLLAALFAVEGACPLIDEPTNHLDEAGRRAVSRYLRGKDGYLLVCHDRAFLDDCTDHILALNQDGPELCGGSFSAWWQQREEKIARAAQRNRALTGEIARLRDSARQAANWSDKVEKTKWTGAAASGLKGDKGHIGHMAAKMAKHSKSVEKRRLSAIQEKEGLFREVESTDALKLSPLPFSGSRLLQLQKVAPDYGQGPVCAPVDLALSPGDCLALTGPNGCGKSSFLRLLAGEDVPHTGQALIPPRLVVSYVPQTTGHLSGSLDSLLRQWQVDVPLFLAILRKLGFAREQFDKDLSSLSAGQKKKVLLSKSLCEPAHLYIWDEPLNYMDLWARQQIEALLRTFRPTLLFVEHDRIFRQTLGADEFPLQRVQGKAEAD